MNIRDEAGGDLVLSMSYAVVHEVFWLEGIIDYKIISQRLIYSYEERE